MFVFMACYTVDAISTVIFTGYEKWDSETAMLLKLGLHSFYFAV